MCYRAECRCCAVGGVAAGLCVSYRSFNEEAVLLHLWFSGEETRMGLNQHVVQRINEQENGATAVSSTIFTTGVNWKG